MAEIFECRCWRKEDKGSFCFSKSQKKSNERSETIPSLSGKEILVRAMKELDRLEAMLSILSVCHCLATVTHWGIVGVAYD